MEDARIISLLFKRDDAAIAALDDRYGALCRHLAGNLLSDPRDVEECVNDAWLAVWDRIPPERPDPLSAYLCRIVKNLAIARYHRNTAHKRNTAYDVSLDDLAECFPSSFSVEDEALARALSRRINHFLADLPAEDRILFVRRFWFGDSPKDLAKLLGVRPHTVSVRLSRLRGKLRTFLEKEGIFS